MTNKMLTNPFEKETKTEIVDNNDMMSVEAAKSAQEVQAAMIVAKRFKRDQSSAYSNIMKTCQRPSLASVAIYSFPKGGGVVSGPSINLAKEMAKNWGNLDYGIREISRTDGESIIETYCWDMESNVRETKIFTVKHERYARGKTTKLTNDRDIYEMIANQGSRRLRACILGILPADVVKDAEEACERTMANDRGDVPLIDRARSMIIAFDKLGVDKDMIENWLKHPIDNIIETQLIDLRKIYNTINQGMGKREDFFKVKGSNTGLAAELNEKLSQKQEKEEISKPKNEEPKAAKKNDRTPEKKEEPKKEKSSKKNDEIEIPTFG